MNIDHKQTSAVMSQCNSFSPLVILASVWKKMVSHTGCPKKIKMCVFRENYRLNHLTPGKLCTCRSDKSCSSYKTPSPPSRFMNKPQPWCHNVIVSVHSSFWRVFGKNGFPHWMSNRFMNKIVVTSTIVHRYLWTGPYVAPFFF
jgi:hypothetical protein